MKVILAIICAVALIGCARGCGRIDPPPTPPSPPPVAPPLPPAEDDKPQDAAAALRSERDRLAADLAAVNSRLKAAEAEKALAPLKALTMWSTYIGGAVALLAVVAGVLVKVGIGLPIGGRLIAGIGLAGLALAATATGLGQSLPWIGPIGIGLLVSLVVAGITWAAITWHRAGQVAAREWKLYAENVPSEIRALLDANSKKAQGRLAGAVDALLGAKP